MENIKLHNAAIITMFVENANRYDTILWDKEFIRIINKFNETYRTPETAMTEQDAMDEMVETKSYIFHRNTDNWWIEIKYPVERFSYQKVIDRKISNYRIVIIDLHTSKIVEKFKYTPVFGIDNNGVSDVTEEVNIEVFNDIWGTIARYNKEHNLYNDNIMKFIFN